MSVLLKPQCNNSSRSSNRSSLPYCEVFDNFRKYCLEYIFVLFLDFCVIFYRLVDIDRIIRLKKSLGIINKGLEWPFSLNIYNYVHFIIDNCFWGPNKINNIHLEKKMSISCWLLGYLLGFFLFFPTFLGCHMMSSVRFGS